MKTLTVTGIDGTTLELDRTGKKIGANSLSIIRKYRDKMIRSAKAYAPVKDGFLKASIGDFQDETGAVNGRTSVLWGVDTDQLGPGWTRYRTRYDKLMEARDGYIVKALWDWEDELIRELKASAGKV